MSSATPPSLPDRRSLFVTALSWVIIVLSALLVPISAISLLMLIAKSYGTATATPLGFLGVVVAPPVTLVAGIGFLRRWKWAWVYVLLLLAILIASNAWELVSPRPETTIYTSASGVPTTTLTSYGSNYHHLPLVLICAALLVKLLSPSVRSEFLGSQTSSPQPAEPLLAFRFLRNWRVGHRGRDGIYYEERNGDSWQRIDIDGEMLMGRAHHVIYFASAAGWQNYPEWARHRRDEIMSRIKSEFREPDYEYEDNGAANSTPPA